MPISLNAAFAGPAAPDSDFDHPPGVSIAKLLSQSLQRAGWLVGDFENWRDVGWRLSCSKGPASVQCAIARVGPNEWVLQVAPASIPRPLGRLFGRKSTATSSDVFELSKAAHRALAASFHELRWRWDGPPTATSPTEPEDAG